MKVITNLSTEVFPCSPNIFSDEAACSLVVLEPLVFLDFIKVRSIRWVLVKNLGYESFDLMTKESRILALTVDNFVICYIFILGLEGRTSSC
jgi:hypothetical protein